MIATIPARAHTRAVVATGVVAVLLSFPILTVALLGLAPATSTSPAGPRTPWASSRR